MPVSPGFRDFVQEQLNRVGRATAKSMFGGVGLYVDGVFMGIVSNDTVYFKVDEVNLPDYAARGMKPFDPYQDGTASMSYYEVPGEVLEDIEDLSVWVRRAVEAGTQKRASKRPGNPKPARDPDAPKKRLNRSTKPSTRQRERHL